MIRLKRGKKIRQQRKKLLKQSQGFMTNRRLYRLRKQNVHHAQTMMYHHRYHRKRLMRQLWIIRLNSIVRLNNMNYSQFIFQCHSNSFILNRKILCQLSLYDTKIVFQSIINH